MNPLWPQNREPGKMAQSLGTVRWKAHRRPAADPGVLGGQWRTATGTDKAFDQSKRAVRPPAQSRDPPGSSVSGAAKAYRLRSLSLP